MSAAVNSALIGRTALLANVSVAGITIRSGSSYTFAEGDVDGAFSVTPKGGVEQSVKIHGLRDFCFAGDDEDNEIILHTDSAEEMLNSL